MHPMLKLLADNRGASRRFEVRAEAEEATVYLYDVIVSDELTAEWMGGVAPKSFIEAVGAITAPVIHLRINSPGGDVFAARAIEQALREHPSTIVAHIDGYAASAATVVAMAADEVAMAKGAFFMIHNSWSVAFGNSADMLDMAALLEKVDGTIAGTYAARTGQELSAVRDWMEAETWFTADEAVEAGFADRVAEEARAQAAWNLGVYAHAPAATRPPAVSPETPAAPVPPPAATDHLRRALEARLPGLRPQAA